MELSIRAELIQPMIDAGDSVELQVGRREWRPVASARLLSHTPYIAIKLADNGQVTMYAPDEHVTIRR